MAQGYKSASGRTVEATGMLFGDKAIKAIAQELYAFGQDVIAASLPLVPVATGALRGSAYAAEPRMEGTHILEELGYGGVATKINPETGEPSSEYAVYVHENLEAHHKVGQAKYLSTPFDEMAPQLGARLKERVPQRMGGAGMGTQDNSGGQGEVP